MPSINDLIKDPAFTADLITSLIESQPDIFFEDDGARENVGVKCCRIRERERFGFDYRSTEWGKLVTDPRVRDPSSKKGKIFRRRFRVPYAVFSWICTKCRIFNVFEIRRENSVEVPLEIKVLIVLRMLGRGECADTLADLSKVSESHCRTIFLLFVKKYRSFLQHEIIYAPQGEELKTIMNEYKLLVMAVKIWKMMMTKMKTLTV